MLDGFRLCFTKATYCFIHQDLIMQLSGLHLHPYCLRVNFAHNYNKRLNWNSTQSIICLTFFFTHDDIKITRQIMSSSSVVDSCATLFHFICWCYKPTISFQPNVTFSFSLIFYYIHILGRKKEIN